MSIRLPEYIDPVRLAENDRLLEGRVSLRRMKRLASILAEKSLSEGNLLRDEDIAEVELKFGKAEGGLATVSGHLSATMQMVCQRCMKIMDHSVDTQVALAVIESNKQAEKLPERYEPLLINQDEGAKDNVSLTELIEDELILALPSVALHKIEDCSAGKQFRSEGAGSETNENQAGSGAVGANANKSEREEQKRPNPFAVLEQLKSKPND